MQLISSPCKTAADCFIINRKTIESKKAGEMIKLLISLLLLIILFLAVTFFIRYQNKIKSKIKTEKGIQESTFIKLGGINQFINIRGENTGNPVILVLHGGPGSPISFLGYHWQTGLESDYTLVNWDQRGCGRTFYENPVPKAKSSAESESAAKSTNESAVKTESAPQTAAPVQVPEPAKELSADLLLADIDELVDYLKERFGQEKIIIMGHSWGTVLGSKYVMAHPEKAAAYIGVGQAVDMPAGEALAKDTAVLRAEADGKQKYIEKLNELYNHVAVAKETDMKSFSKMRGMTSKYLVSSGAMHGLQMIMTGLTSPDMSMRDLRWQLLAMLNTKQLFALEAPLLPAIFNFNIYEAGTKYEIPAYFISGDGDWITPYPLVRKYAKTVTAPKKDMILIENTGHSPFIDNPKAFCKAVRKVLK